LFPGNSWKDQIVKIFEVLGTPEENDWEDGAKMAMRYSIEINRRTTLAAILPSSLSSDAFDLIQGLLEMNPSKRLSCREALDMPFFKPMT